MACLNLVFCVYRCTVMQHTAYSYECCIENAEVNLSPIKEPLVSVCMRHVCRGERLNGC